MKIAKAIARTSENKMFNEITFFMNSLAPSIRENLEDLSGLYGSYDSPIVLLKSNHLILSWLLTDINLCF